MQKGHVFTVEYRLTHGGPIHTARVHTDDYLDAWERAANGRNIRLHRIIPSEA